MRKLHWYMPLSALAGVVYLICLFATGSLAHGASIVVPGDTGYQFAVITNLLLVFTPLFITIVGGAVYYCEHKKTSARIAGILAAEGFTCAGATTTFVHHLPQSIIAVVVVAPVSGILFGGLGGLIAARIITNSSPPT